MPDTDLSRRSSTNEILGFSDNVINEFFPDRRTTPKMPDTTQKTSDLSDDVMREFFPERIQPKIPEEKKKKETPGTTLGAFAKTLTRVPENLVASAITAVQGVEGASVTDRGLGDKIVNWVDERNKALAEEYKDAGDFIPGVISKQDVAQLGQNLAFSGISMGSTLAAGAVGTLATPIVGVAAGMAAGGVTAHRMQSYTAMNDWLNKKNEESIRQFGRPISLEEEKQFKAAFETLASESGLWEAGPEAVGNVLELALMAGKGTLPGRIAAMLPKGIAGKIVKGVARTAGIIGTETATETVTQMGQQNVEVKAGQSNEPLREWTSGDDWLKSAREVLPQVLLLSGVMSAGGSVYRKATEGKRDTQYYSNIAKQTDLENDIKAWKAEGVSDKDIAGRVTVRLKEYTDKILPEINSTLSENAQMPQIPADIDANAMTSYVLYGKKAESAKTSVMRSMGMKPPSAQPATDAAPMTTSAADSKTIVTEGQRQATLDEAKGKDTAAKINALFNSVVNAKLAETQELEAARIAENTRRDEETAQLAAQDAAQTQNAVTDAQSQQSVLKTSLAGNDVRKQAIVDDVLNLTERSLLTTAQKETGLTIVPAGPGIYTIETPNGPQPINLLQIRQQVAASRISNLDAKDEQNKSDAEAMRKSAEEAAIKKEKKDAENRLKFSRQSLATGATLSPEQKQVLEENRAQLTADEIAKLEKIPLNPPLEKGKISSPAPISNTLSESPEGDAKENPDYRAANIDEAAHTQALIGSMLLDLDNSSKAQLVHTAMGTSKRQGTGIVWLTDVVKGGLDVSRADARTVLNTAQKNETLTPRQQTIFDAITKAATKRGGNKMAQNISWAEKGFVAVPDKQIAVNDLVEGDQFVVSGEEFKVTDIDEKGNVTMKDGTIRTVKEGSIINHVDFIKQSEKTTDFNPDDLTSDQQTSKLSEIAAAKEQEYADLIETEFAALAKEGIDTGTIAESTSSLFQNFQKNNSRQESGLTEDEFIIALADFYELISHPLGIQFKGFQSGMPMFAGTASEAMTGFVKGPQDQSVISALNRKKQQFQNEPAKDMAQVGQPSAAIESTTGLKKEPWQMTKAEYANWRFEKEKHLYAKDATVEGFRDFLDKGHQAEIKSALEQGKSVPREVLAGYPNLIKTKTTAAIEATTGLKKNTKAESSDLFATKAENNGGKTSLYEMAAALASGDERAIKLAGLNADINNLENLRSAHYQAQRQLNMDQAASETKQKYLQTRINYLKEAEEKIPEYIGHAIDGKAGKSAFTERKPFGEALVKQMVTLQKEGKEVKTQIGTISGLPLIASITSHGDVIEATGTERKTIFSGMVNQLILRVTDRISYEVAADVTENSDPSGLVTRIANRVNGVSADLSNVEHELAAEETNIKKINARLGSPFEFAQELHEKIAEAAQINTALTQESKTNAVATPDPNDPHHGQPPDDGTKLSIEPTFYSQLARVVAAKLPNTGTSEQFRTMINAWANKGEFKADELKWSGLDDYLKEKQGKITKQDVVDYLAANQVEIKEITKGAKELFDGWSEPDIRYYYQYLFDESSEGQSIEDVKSAIRQEEIYTTGYKTGIPKFSAYQLPGGENYRELLLTLPSSEPSGTNEAKSQLGDFWDRMSEKYGELPQTALILKLTNTEKEERRRLNAAVPPKPSDYRSPHWDESNVLAHVRMNDRIIPAEGAQQYDKDYQAWIDNGKKGAAPDPNNYGKDQRVLLLEEVQSDWHQEGRKKGYIENPRQFYDEKGNIPDDRLQASIDAIGKVPTAPFSKTWPELVMKRMLRYAAENGYDKLAWTTGEQQAERYDLSKHLDRIEYEKAYSEEENPITGKTEHIPTGFYELIAYGINGEQVLREDEISLDRVEELVGKDLAAKIQKDEGILKKDSPYREWKTLSGLDLKVGGEGMKGFYDTILPAFMNKYAKKWGAKVGETKLSIPEKNARPLLFDSLGEAKTWAENNLSDHEYSVQRTANNQYNIWDDYSKKFATNIINQPSAVHSIDITPVMKESVMTGQPMFAHDKTGAQRLGDVQLKDLVRDLTAIAKGLNVTEKDGELWIKTKSGDEVRIVSAEAISPDGVALTIQKHYAQEQMAGKRIAGMYQPKEQKITLVKDVAGIWTLSHEFYHFLEHIGAISNADKALLNNKISSLIAKDAETYGYLEGRSLPEQRAEWIGRTLTGMYDATSPSGKIIARIRAIIDRIINALGIRTAGGVVRDIETGRIYNNGTENSKSRDNHLSITDHWWEGRDWQKEINNLPRKYWEKTAPRNFLREGYIPITRAEADYFEKKGIDNATGHVNIRGAETTGEEGWFMKPLNYNSKDYVSGQTQRNKEVEKLYAKYLHRYQAETLRPAPGKDINNEQGLRNNPTLREEYPQLSLAEDLTDKATAAAGRKVSRAVELMTGKISPERREVLGALKKQWKEFWQPFSTVKDGDQVLARRYESMGNVAKAVKFIEAVKTELDAFPDEVKKDMFWYLNGDIPVESLPEDAREIAKNIQRRTEIIGEMLVDRGILTQETFNAHKGKYIHYLYAKHIVGEDAPVGITSSGKLDLSYTLQRNPNLTMQQRKELGLIEDASVAVPVGMGKALTDIAKFDYLKTIADNPEWVWQPSVVRVPIGKPLANAIHGRTRRYVMMGVGKLVEEVKQYGEMMRVQPSPEVAEIHKILSNALDKAQKATENAPADFVQLPNTKGYGPLAGAFVAKPIADDIRPVMDVATDRGKLLNTIVSIERQGMAAFKMGKVALNFPTAVRNMFSNIIQINMSGRSLAKIPGDLIKAAESMKAKDSFFQEASSMGLFNTNWFATEINDVLQEFRHAETGRIDKVVTAIKNIAKYYGSIDDFFKLSLFRHSRESGMSVDQAALHAMKWGMDYSLTSRSIKGLRQTIMPFATYQYKIAPLIAESIKKRPWVLAKFALVYPLAKMMTMALHGLDDDDWDDLLKQLPAYIKKSGSMMILPWKTDKGQWQWVNLEYFFPWGNYLAMFRDAKEKDSGEFLRDLGVGNPFLSMFFTGLSARDDQPPIHSYFGTPIYNELDPAPVKAAKYLEYMANTWMPSMLTRQGALGYVGKFIAGDEDRWGRSVNLSQAAGRWFGVNIVSVSPEQSRAQVSVQVQELHKEMARIEADPSRSPEEKAAYKARMNEKIAEIAQEAPAAILPITKAKGHDVVYEALQAMAAKGILHTSPPSLSVEITGIPMKMSMEQYREYLDKSSEIARRKLEVLVSSAAWETMPDHRKGEVVEHIVANARKSIRQKIKGEILRDNRDKIIEERIKQQTKIS